MTALPCPNVEMTDGLSRKEREMRLEDVIHLLSSSQWPIFGFEGEGGQGGNSNSSESEEEEEENEEEEGEEEDEEDSSKSKKGGKKGEDDEDDVEGLKSALKKERNARREAQRGLKSLKSEFDNFKSQQSKGEKEKEDAETKRQAEAAVTKLERVAVGFAKNAVDTALIRALQSSKAPKFQDPDDVLRLIDRDDIDVDQDDDDPSKVTVDSEDVRRALKDLAKRKPHLLIKGDEEEGSSGGSGNSGSNAGGKTGKFGGGNSNTKGQQRRQELMQKYPALTRK